MKTFKSIINLWHLNKCKTTFKFVWQSKGFTEQKKKGVIILFTSSQFKTTQANVTMNRKKVQ